jgi:hypothetical protein
VLELSGTPYLEKAKSGTFTSFITSNNSQEAYVAVFADVHAG